MSRMTNPDNDLMIEQQERDLHHAGQSQPERAKRLEDETDAEKIESDAIANDGLGGAYREQDKSETEEALERARGTAREQVKPGRGQSG